MLVPTNRHQRMTLFIPMYIYFIEFKFIYKELSIQNVSNFTT
jgi:hypothetical protein